MIKIEIDSQKMDEIEKFHGKWIKRQKIIEKIGIKITPRTSVNLQTLNLMNEKERIIKYTNSRSLGVENKKILNELLEYLAKNNNSICSYDFELIEKIIKTKLVNKCLDSIKEHYKILLTEIDEIKNLNTSNFINEFFLDSENVDFFIKKEKMEEAFQKYRYKPMNDLSINYKLMLTKEDKTNHRHNLISMTDMRVCPYCQRQYITNYQDNKNKTTADLDHFYPKSKYPFLALSLYNFIPSCQICNSRMKGDKDTVGTVYPYDESFDELGGHFSSNLDLIKAIVDSNPNTIEIEIKIENGDNKEKIKKSIDVFKLDKVYKKSHSSYLYDMIYNIEKHPDSYLEDIAEIFVGSECSECEDKNKIEKKVKEKFKQKLKEIVMKPYLDRIEKGEPLAKLTKDILKEHGLYNEN